MVGTRRGWWALFAGKDDPSEPRSSPLGYRWYEGEPQETRLERAACASASGFGIHSPKTVGVADEPAVGIVDIVDTADGRSLGQEADFANPTSQHIPKCCTRDSKAQSAAVSLVGFVAGFGVDFVLGSASSKLGLEMLARHSVECCRAHGPGQGGWVGRS